MAWEQSIETIVPPTKLSFVPSECSKSKEKKNKNDILLEELDNSVNNTIPTSTKGQLKKQKLSVMTSKDKNIEMMSQLDDLIKKQTNK